MKNKLKKLLIIGIFCVFSFCSITSVPVLADSPNTSDIVQTVEKQIPLKAPIGRKQLAKKFILAMMGVAVSSVLIYVLLSIYNRFLYGNPNKKALKTEDDDFKTPNNLKDALDIFLKKTK